jgi:hypothetical protein
MLVVLVAFAATLGFLAGVGRTFGGLAKEVRLPLVIAVSVVVLLGSMAAALAISKPNREGGKGSREGETSGLEVVSPEALRAVFAETNQHLRNAEQKQLTITGGYLGLFTIVLSRFPAENAKDSDRRLFVWVLAFVTIVGCCVFLLQAWCRVWKEHYLRVVLQIAQSWGLPDHMLPYWLRRDLRKPPDYAVFRANVDNTLMYLTFGMNGAFVILLSKELFPVLDHGLASAVAAGIGALYMMFLWRVHVLVKNRRDLLSA